MPRNALVLPIQLYRWLLSPVLGAHCRFAPSCSAYAVDAIRSRGALKGGFLAARRVLRCHPFADGGYDPVPAEGAEARDGGR